MKKHTMIGVCLLAAAASPLAGCVGGGADGKTETVNQGQEAEPDPHGATIVLPGEEVHGAIRRGDGPVLYGVDVRAGEELIAVTSLGTLRDTTLTLADARGRTLAYNDDYGRSYASRITHSVRSEGRLYLQVGAYSRRQVGSFGLIVRIPNRIDEPTPDPEPEPQEQCFRGGCSGQVCSDDPNAISTCEFRPEYMCYRAATCERQTTGDCGWTMDEALRECLAQFDPDPEPEPEPDPDPEPEPQPECFVGGCSSQVCSDQPGAISTCEWRPEYACYRGATCERQAASGQCGWTMDDDLRECLEQFEPGPGPALDDHADELAGATLIVPGVRAGGVIEEGGDQDWFVFAAGPFGGRFTITTDLGTLADTRLLATDDGGRQLAENDDYAGGGYASQVHVMVHPFQRIGLRVTAYSRRQTGTYGITVTPPVVDPGPVPDPPDNDDHSDTPDGATAIDVGDTVQGEIEEGGDADWFTFPAGFGTEYVITTELGTLRDTTLLVTDVAGRELGSNDDFGGSYASQVTLVTDAEGRLLVKVAAYSRRQLGTYTLTVTGPPVRPVPMCNRDAGEAECAAFGGRFGRFGLLGQVQCICPTSDGGQACSTGDDCQGACVCDGFGRDAQQGECSPWVVDFGCYCTMVNGRGATICVD